MTKYSEASEHPSLSLIIPYQDNWDEVIELLSSLEEQTYPADKIEIFLIYNGMESGLIDETIPNSRKFRIVMLEERQYLNSPYSARNRGLEKANGEIIVFIDANSTPDKKWLENGVKCLADGHFDLIAGQVDFDFGNKLTATKIVDSLTSIDMKSAVKERGVAYTANLFISSEIFRKSGLFEEQIRSGGDVRFTLKATAAGFKVGYCANAIVRKKAREFRKLYEKKIRTGRGYFYTWKSESQKQVWFYNLFRSLKPPTIRKHNLSNYPVNKLAVWFHLYLVGIVEQIAFVLEYLKYNLGSDRDIDRRDKMEGKSSE